MTESSRRSDSWWHCCWKRRSLKRCSGSLSFLCRRSARCCSFSASRSACCFSQSAILQHNTRQGLPGNSRSLHPSARLVLFLVVDVSQASAAQVSAGFPVCGLLDLSAQSPQHGAEACETVQGDTTEEDGRLGTAVRDTPPLPPQRRGCR